MLSMFFDKAQEMEFQNQKQDLGLEEYKNQELKKQEMRKRDPRGGVSKGN